MIFLLTENFCLTSFKMSLTGFSSKLRAEVSAHINHSVLIISLLFIQSVFCSCSQPLRAHLVQHKYRLVFRLFSHNLIYLSKNALYFKRRFLERQFTKWKTGIWPLLVVLATISAVLVVVVVLRIYCGFMNKFLHFREPRLSLAWEKKYKEGSSLSQNFKPSYNRKFIVLPSHFCCLMTVKY
jgi:hypothetical protein